MNYSKQREIILKALQKMQNHPTVDAVYETVKKDVPNISLATVYRNLNKLAEAGLVKRIEGLEESVHFDHEVFDHHHFICSKCRRVFDISYDIAPDLVKKTEDDTGFLVESYDLSFKGLCQYCRKTN